MKTNLYVINFFLLMAMVFSNSVGTNNVFQKHYSTTEANAVKADEQLQIMADGQFVYGPNANDFNLVGFLEKLESPLLPYSDLILDKATYYSINPRVLLTILEMSSGSVTTKTKPIDSENLLGYTDIYGLDVQLEELCQSATYAYYHRLYQTDESANFSHVILKSGETKELSEDINAGSLAILIAMAPLSEESEWINITSPEKKYGFTQTYLRLFPESDPLDNSNNVIPKASPPADFLKLPFSGGDTWRLTGGPHGDVDEAIDFQPTGVSGCTIPTNRWATAVAAGNVTSVTCGGCLVRISHADSWGSYYYHMANTQVGTGAIVKDQNIGNPSQRPTCGGTCGTCSGSASGSHVHYALLYNGAFTTIIGAPFENWIVYKISDDYSGYLERNGQRVNQWGQVQSDFTPPSNPTGVNPNCVAQSGVWQNTCSDPSFTWSGATDAISGVAGYQYYWGPDPVGTAANWTTYPGFDPLANSSGTNYLRVRTKDWSGNWSNWITLFEMKFDNIPPLLSDDVNPGCVATSGTWQNTCNDANFTWGAASDLHSGLAGYEYKWASGGAVWTTGVTYDPVEVTDGSYDLQIRAKDQVGNWSSWKTIFTLKFDSTAPLGSISLNQDSSVSYLSLVQAMTFAQDPHSGTAYMRLRNAGDIWNEWVPITPESYWLLPGITNTNYLVEVQYKDRVGNISGIYSDSILLNLYPDTPSSTNYAIRKSTFGASSFQGQSQSFHLSGTLGQPSMVGNTASSSFDLWSGFWYKVQQKMHIFLPVIVR